MHELGELIAVGLLGQKDGLGLTANEARVIAEDMAAHIVGKGPFGELDAAWAEAEAALPEGWVLCDLDLRLPSGATLKPFWGAEATLIVDGSWAGSFTRVDGVPIADEENGMEGTGATPAIALRSLTANLRRLY